MKLILSVEDLRRLVSDPFVGAQRADFEILVLWTPLKSEVGSSRSVFYDHNVQSR
jgi:hypothetical protein